MALPFSLDAGAAACRAGAILAAARLRGHSGFGCAALALLGLARSVVR